RAQLLPGHVGARLELRLAGRGIEVDLVPADRQVDPRRQCRDEERQVAEPHRFLVGLPVPLALGGVPENAARDLRLALELARKEFIELHATLPGVEAPRLSVLSLRLLYVRARHDSERVI